MKLCYIWVDEYKNLENFGLNLCSEIQYIYDHNTLTLTESRKPSRPTGLFDEKFNDITAIVGKNAAGKSNSLDLICNVLSKDIRAFKSYIFIVEEDGKRHLISSEDKKISFTNKTNIKIDKNTKPSLLKSSNVIFFSNVYDTNEYYPPLGFGSEKSNLKIISPNNNYNLRSNRISRNSGSLFMKQLNFIKNIGRKNLEEIEFDVPDNIIVRVLNRPLREHLRHIEKNTDTDSIRNFDRRAMSTVNGLIINKNNEHSSIEQYVNILKTSIITKAIGTHFIRHQRIDKTNEIDSSFLDKIEIHDHQKTFKILERQGIDVENDIKRHFYHIDQLNSDTNKSIDISLDLSSRHPRYSKFKIKFKTSEKTSSNLYSHIDYLAMNGIIRVDWEGISSGHNAFLTLFSLILDALKGTRSDTLICIDEGDLYLHPKWQIQFFRNIEKIIPQFSGSESQKVQLVLTSHSPFLLTDLPRNNIIILNNGKVENTSLRTFGANLYDLYDQAFFLDNEKIGTFAYNKIMSVFENFEQYNEEEKKNALLLVDMIGDDLIRNHIEDAIIHD